MMARAGGWRLREDPLCRVQRPRRAAVPVAVEPAAAEVTAPGERLPTLEEEIARLAATRERVERRIEERLGGCEPGEAVRYLAVLSQVARSVAAMLGQRGGGSGGQEMERVLADAARVVRQRHEL